MKLNCIVIGLSKRPISKNKLLSRKNQIEENKRIHETLFLAI